MSLKYENLIRKMTLAEKAIMMSGKNTWETVDFEKYGIPSMVMSDGPHGLRRQAGAGDHLGLNASLPATCFPTAAGVANSWDEALGEEIGEALAEEAVTMGVNVILGPGLNIKRSPLCGRNFEYFSEDPYHAGKMAAAYVRGIQSKGIAACPKHFAANSQELRRMANDSVVDERTFREIYTTGFEIAIKEGKSKSIMSSYNEVNGIYANENNHMLQEILVDEWGFDGFVVSDWGGSNDHALGVMNGSHLEMPGTGKSGMRDIVRAVKDGTLPEEVLDQRLDELLNVVFATHQATVDGKGKKFDVEGHHALARKAAEEEARRKAEEEAARKAAEEEARRKAEEESRKKAEEESRKAAEEESKRKAAEEASRAAKKGSSKADTTTKGQEATTSKSNTSTNQTTSNGKFIWPLTSNTYISSYFSMRNNPFGGSGTEFHNGIDIPASTGTAVMAVSGGQVAWSSLSSSAGNWIGIDHGNGIYSVYMHMSSRLVKEGDYVTAGQTIGLVGSTGRSTAPHLHLSIRLNGSYVDPLDYVSP